jgi:PEP-CTERM motif
MTTKLWALPMLFVTSAVLSQASIITLTFEGLQDEESISNFYNGGTGGSGSGPGPNFGITFSPNSLAIIQNNQGGTGNFGGEPSPNTVAFFLSGGPNGALGDVMNVAAGFTTGFSFFYSAANDPGSVNVWSGLNATGTLLATISLPVTANDGGGCPTNPGANFCPFVADGVTFNGTAMSVDFGGTANQIGFDNITLGSSTPTGSAPEPSTLLTLGGGLVLFAAFRFRNALINGLR